MITPKIGISFRETMSGPFSLGAVEPHTGAEQGKAADHTFTMHATVTIDDLDRFITDPDHAGSIVGEIDFHPLGNKLPAKRGVFNLFSPAGDPSTKYMVYELAFESGGKPYYMAGKKEVKDDPGLDVWSDTTTLFTRLHSGNDATGPVVGAGILKLSVMALLKMVPTMTVLNASNAIEKAKALEKFGRFFGSKVYDAYVKGPPKNAH